LIEIRIIKEEEWKQHVDGSDALGCMKALRKGVQTRIIAIPLS